MYYAGLVDDILDFQEQLNDWELNFLESVMNLPDCQCSAKRRIKIEQIYDKVVGDRQ